MVVAPLTGVTFAADLLRGGGGFRAGLHCGDTFAHGLDDRREFMPLHNRVGGEGMLAVPDVDIRATDADLLDTQENLPRARNRFGDVVELAKGKYSAFIVAKMIKVEKDKENNKAQKGKKGKEGKGEKGGNVFIKVKKGR